MQLHCGFLWYSVLQNHSGHNIIRSIKAGDIVYIKKCNVGSDITVRAIGIVTDYETKSISNVAKIARNVKWIYIDSFVL